MGEGVIARPGKRRCTLRHGAGRCASERGEATLRLTLSRRQMRPPRDIVWHDLGREAQWVMAPKRWSLLVEDYAQKQWF